MIRPYKPLESIISMIQESAKVFSELTAAASKASLQTNSTLTGVAGGLFGIGIAYALATTYSLSLPTVGPIFTGLGMVGGVMISRGSARVRFERALEENRIAAAEIMARIKALPKNAPEKNRDALWETYRDLCSIASIANIMIDGKHIESARMSRNKRESLPEDMDD